MARHVLPAGPGRPKGAKNKATQAVQAIARGLVEDPAYTKKLQERLNKGRIAPAMETTLWHYAYGKPKETVAGDTEHPLEIIVRHVERRLNERATED
jgi:hypothetical protein